MKGKQAERIDSRLQPSPGAILVHHVESRSDRLDLGNGVVLLRIGKLNLQEMQARFPSFKETVHAYGWCLDYPCEWSTPSELHDLFTLIRLFRPGTVSFIANARHLPDSGWVEIRDNLILSYLPERHPYRMEDSDCPEFVSFCKEMRRNENWNSFWFGTAREHFLRASSTHFSLVRAAYEPWGLLRQLGHMMALEACLLPEVDCLIGRRLRERAVGLLGLAKRSTEAVALRKRLKNMYKIRSELAHGCTIECEDLANLREDMSCFEADVRRLLCAALRKIPSGTEQARREYLSAIFDPTDDDRMGELVASAGRLKNQELKAKVTCWLRGCRE